MKSRLFYLVSLHMRGMKEYPHGEVICTFDEVLTDEQVQNISDALGCANIHLVDEATYLKEYKQEAV